MSADAEAAPKAWRGRFYEDFDPGDIFRSRFGRTLRGRRQAEWRVGVRGQALAERPSLQVV